MGLRRMRNRPPFANIEEKEYPDYSQTDFSSWSFLDLVTEIVTQGENSRLSDDYLKCAAPLLQTLADRQKITKDEALLLSAFVNNSISNWTDLQDLTIFFGCSNMDIIKKSPCIKHLVDTDLLISGGHNEFSNQHSYRVPDELLESYRDNKPYTPRSLACKDIVSLLAELFDITHDLHERDITYDRFYHLMDKLYAQNAHLPVMMMLDDMKCCNYDKLIVLQFLRHLMFHNERSLQMESLAFLYEEGPKRNRFIYNMEHGNGFLYKNRIVEFASANGLVDNESYQLTDRIIKKLVPDFKLKEEAPSANKCVDIIRYQDIARKKLYFDGQTSKQVDQLAHILTDTNFKKVQTRLKASGFRQGFACLFYGAPGTGKTELCLQLAKKTGRDVMQVNISQLRSMWVGGSEKNLQGLFDNYRDMVARSKKAPLLLFNEADAIIQKRSENSRNAVDKMENTLQNILLENIEKLDGILIATTNLQNTMDKAFERRFIYKIRFNKPTIEARTSIWKSMLGVNKATATQLAKNYEFSGGQIENIARKSTVDKILYGTTDFTFETLKDYCDSELIDNQQKPINRIGF